MEDKVLLRINLAKYDVVIEPIARLHYPYQNSGQPLFVTIF